MIPEENKLPEQYVQDSFHSYLKSSLTQAKVEKLLEPEVLASAEGDLMITGPALCLYFAALRSTTIPPSVPLPRSSKSAPPRELTESNCPPTFLSFLRVWASNVSRIQGLEPNSQHDLARVICGLPPLTQPVDPALSGIAADLRAVAIEISQRRSFQDRYATDLQAALDAGSSSGSTLKVKASFVPPPVYDASGYTDSKSTGKTSPPASPASAFPPRTPSPMLFLEHSPAIERIRQILYAALGDVLAGSHTLGRLLKWDPPRAYFASVSLAILEVGTRAVNPDGSVDGGAGMKVTLGECPEGLKPLMRELAGIGRQAGEMSAEDDKGAVEALEKGEEMPEPRLERVRKMLEGGVGYDRDASGVGGRDEGRRRSVEGRAVAFSNRINALALNISKVKAFRERQAEVFDILSAVCGT
ncbi:hypothetical protein HYDPIDRAFT_117272 [Hydnomerulius pinastri MD-312]|uniref:Uncharacterized protein n=1 Tax=Hydnomerulius pinastri MD-312 TaxID=994086 RepID=A0A0C9V4G1_9AGAM|nr:hypothetical protein HYDPIDRAFT_117272 [Hydnomerulius pinastri MD-312]